MYGMFAASPPVVIADLGGLDLKLTRERYTNFMGGSDNGVVTIFRYLRPSEPYRNLETVDVPQDWPSLIEFIEALARKANRSCSYVVNVLLLVFFSMYYFRADKRSKSDFVSDPGRRISDNAAYLGEHTYSIDSEVVFHGVRSVLFTCMCELAELSVGGSGRALPSLRIYNFFRVVHQLSLTYPLYSMLNK